jgi:hypothetical protein
VFYDVYNELGCGFLEAVYVEALTVALREAGLSVEREVALKVSFRGNIVGLLLNFGPRPQFKRLVFENHLKKHSYYICPELGRGAPAGNGTIRSHQRSSVAS